MIRHILLIKFKATAKLSDIEILRKEFYSMVDKIEGVITVEWGLNNSSEGMAKEYSHAVVMSFEDEAARQRYLPHPDHSELKKIFIPLLEDIIVFDYNV